MNRSNIEKAFVKKDITLPNVLIGENDVYILMLFFNNIEASNLYLGTIEHNY
jgi:hypothetical protein